MKKSNNQRGPFRILSKRTVYKNPWIRVREDKVISPDGTPGIFGVVETKGGVTIVPVDKKGFCYLIKEFAYATKKLEVNLPGGGLDEKEKPLNAAKRELLEETGLISNNWRYLGKVNYFTNIFSTPEHLFLAFDVRRFRKIHKKEAEIVKVFKLPFTQVVKMAQNGKLDSAERCTAIFRASSYLKFKKPDKAFAKID